MSDGRQQQQAQAVQEMFTAIAPRYDFLNRLLSLGIDQQWRRFVGRRLAHLNCPRVLDVACGTADLSLAIQQANPGAEVVGLDFSEQMLVLGQQKVERLAMGDRITLLAASAEDLPFPDNSFDALSIAFGIRNVIDRHKALMEFYRVLKSGTMVVVLEFSMPEQAVLNRLYQWYFLKVLPLIGGLFARKSAYQYLPESVVNFPGRNEFSLMLKEAGFSRCRYHSLTFGIVTVYLAEKP
ncbi:MAG: bifunctional demethylmenaquinone methyltransferase/2-methoxy-6-polyprenyl-1,4-benzoquinol methylase UbiE [Deltaproteobacteria bacterium]|nr:bifunctional demethylmenaquinone methyltransferase/2-methoxy-6-polyprenyl-1,4-benzoquinol methylase UbiE [Candidatus Anaeroferrophillus wilburensis]MBN2888113.1 bifunctional demethylmenaquinone methyltransferase/2-methoxy-6-polyprenyl-1,4-benzoquinol methylase UbiE [Deltaproteobacteria bacterium]